MHVRVSRQFLARNAAVALSTRYRRLFWRPRSFSRACGTKPRIAIGHVLFLANPYRSSGRETACERANSLFSGIKPYQIGASILMLAQVLGCGGHAMLLQRQMWGQPLRPAASVLPIHRRALAMIVPLADGRDGDPARRQFFNKSRSRKGKA